MLKKITYIRFSEFSFLVLGALIVWSCAVPVDNSSPREYNITVEQSIESLDYGGFIEVYPTSAVEGTTVTITVDTYEYYDIRVQKERLLKGHPEIELSEKISNENPRIREYTFIMPASDLVIEGCFEVITELGDLKVTAGEKSYALIPLFSPETADYVVQLPGEIAYRLTQTGSTSANTVLITFEPLLYTKDRVDVTYEWTRENGSTDTTSNVLLNKDMLTIKVSSKEFWDQGNVKTYTLTLELGNI